MISYKLKRVYYILFVVVVLLAVNTAWAQDEHGDVVVHSDPRMGVLLKKERVIAKAAERPHTTTRMTAEDNQLMAKAVMPAKPGAPAATPEAKPVGIVKEPMPPPSKPFQRIVSPPHGKVIYSGKGFRVQIYNGPDREKAMDIKMDFMRHNPAVRTYITYTSPCFRVKIGNYRHRSDAEGMYREAKSTYSPCMIVPDIITINTY